MRKLATVVVIVAAFALFRTHFQQQKEREAEATDTPAALADSSDLQPEREDSDSAAVARYRCDGRNRCPQMHSCEEATWFIQNCSGMEMDGDNDGIPCERQWCR